MEVEHDEIWDWLFRRTQEGQGLGPLLTTLTSHGMPLFLIARRDMASSSRLSSTRIIDCGLMFKTVTLSSIPPGLRLMPACLFVSVNSPTAKALTCAAQFWEGQWVSNLTVCSFGNQRSWERLEIYFVVFRRSRGFAFANLSCPYPARSGGYCARPLFCCLGPESSRYRNHQSDHPGPCWSPRGIWHAR